MTQATIGEIFTSDELERAQRLYETCPAGTFATRCAAEVVTPALPRINARLGQENDAKYLAYALEMALAQASAPAPGR